ncbi:MAG TPA: TerC family protein [Hyphomicrobiaceae bacterium]|nr:TerC family protein [Hyphomicrobiaceae bacterium]
MELLAWLGGSVVLAPITDQWVEWFGSLFGSHALTAIAIAKIIGINIILSGDNAVVIALACRNLKPRERTWGIILGAGAAVVLRIIFTVIIQHLLGIPWLQLCGGLLLIWIAVKLLIADEPEDDNVASGSNLWEAVKIVAIADVVMSLDNVLAIAAAAMQAPTDQQLWLIVLGLVISIPLVVAGSTLIMSLLTRYPVLVWAGAGLLGWIAGELLVGDLMSVTQLQAWDPSLVVVDPESAAGLRPVGRVLYSAAALGAGLVLLVGWLLLRRRGNVGVEGGAAE